MSRRRQDDDFYKRPSNVDNNSGSKGRKLSDSASSGDEVDANKDLHRRTEDRRRVSYPEAPRREENPFSFKHFLKKDVQSFEYAGARPKIYSPHNLNNIDGEPSSLFSRNPTELPDFVQDHLIVEQCYLDNSHGNSQSIDVDNLPDFAISSVEQRQMKAKVEQEVRRDLSFDLAGSVDERIRQKEFSPKNNVSSSPLDLPKFNRNDSVSTANDRAVDLGNVYQPHFNNYGVNSALNNGVADIQNCQSTSNSDFTKSLPDFLNDGPIRPNRQSLSPDPSPPTNSTESPDRRLLMENERLRQKLEVYRRQSNERARRIQVLEADLNKHKENEWEETAHLEKAMQQVEDKLLKSTQHAESAVSQLKQEIKWLKSELRSLRLENQELRIQLSDQSGGSAINTNSTVKKLAGDLRSAASTAELSLRQLMSGVENLRDLASALENADRIEDRTKDFLPDSDEDNAAGPAL